MMVHEAAHKWTADFVAKHPVLVGFSPGMKLRVEIERSLFDVTDADGLGQQPVHGLAEVHGRYGVRESHRGHLPLRVHAGVGSSRSGYVYRLAFDKGNDLLERALNGGETGLLLPAMEIGTVVGHSETQAPQARSSSIRV